MVEQKKNMKLPDSHLKKGFKVKALNTPKGSFNVRSYKFGSNLINSKMVCYEIDKSILCKRLGGPFAVAITKCMSA